MSKKPPQDPATTSQSSLSAKASIGFVDECLGGVVTGWAQAPWAPAHPAIVDVLVDGKEVGSARANLFRQDLKDLGIREGFAGFQFQIPADCHDGQPHELQVVERTTKRQLFGVSQFRADARQGSLSKGQLFLNSVQLASSTDNPEFISRLKARKRLAVLCAFTPANDLYDYHHVMISALQKVGFVVMLGQSFTNTSGADVGEVQPPASQADAYLVKDNLGYDFGTWLSCLVAVKEHISSLDEVLLINDSVFGPLTDLGEFWKRVEQVSTDVVGICDSYEHNFHLQSFFLLFRRRVLESRFFSEFIEKYEYSNEKDRVIREGELALTPELTSAGFSCAAVYPYEDLAAHWLKNLSRAFDEVMSLPENRFGQAPDTRPPEIEYLANLARHIRRGDPVNPTHFFWDVLLELGCPFIKRELVLKNPGANPNLYKARDMIAATGYPLPLIKDAASRFGATKVYF